MHVPPIGLKPAFGHKRYKGKSRQHAQHELKALKAIQARLEMRTGEKKNLKHLMALGTIDADSLDIQATASQPKV